MNLERAFATLSDPKLKRYPQDALDSVKTQWAQALPHLDNLMARFTAGEEVDAAAESLLFYAVLLLAEQGESSRFNALLALCDPGPALQKKLDSILGDAVTELLPTIFYVLANAQPQPLISLINSDTADEFVKLAAIHALFAQLESNQITSAIIVSELKSLITSLDQHRHSYALCDLTYYAIRFDFNTVQQQLMQLAKSRRIDDESTLRRAIKSWSAPGYFETALASEHVKTQFAVAQIKHWHCFERTKAERQREEEKILQALADIQQKGFVAAPVREGDKIGRNDACPCGSGKKYKKCCLNS